MPEWHQTQPWCLTCFAAHQPRIDRNSRPIPDAECCMCAKPLGQGMTAMAHAEDPKYPSITTDGEVVQVIAW